VIYDPFAASRVDPGKHASRSRNSPFAGMDLPGQVRATFLRGEPIVLDGKLAPHAGPDGRAATDRELAARERQHAEPGR
jgi:dihydroorotase